MKTSSLNFLSWKMNDCWWYSHFYSQLILSVFLEHINYCYLKQLNFTSRPTDSEFLDEGFCSAFLASTVGYSDTELPQAMFRKSLSPLLMTPRGPPSTLHPLCSPQSYGSLAQELSPSSQIYSSSASVIPNYFPRSSLQSISQRRLSQCHQGRSIS